MTTSTMDSVSPIYTIDKGIERKAILQNASSQDVTKALEQLVKN